jgi:hypothetical protein
MTDMDTEQRDAEERRECRGCQRSLRIECFPRKNDNKDWLGNGRLYVPREEVCSECRSEEALRRRESLGLEQRLKPHVARCFKRSRRRNADRCNEGITLEAIMRRYREQEGRCLYCRCVLEFQTRGMGWNLCMEDREALGVWPSTDDLLTVDRVDASDPSIPYVDSDTGRENFSLLCFACNREKYYEEDAAEKLAARNAALLQRVQELEGELSACRRAMGETSATLIEGRCSEVTAHALFAEQIRSLMTQNSLLEGDLKTLRRLARNNFVQPITIQTRATLSPPKRKTDPTQDKNRSPLRLRIKIPKPHPSEKRNTHSENSSKRRV